MKLTFFVPGIPAPGGSKRPHKATDEEIARLYAEHQSIHKVAKIVGMCAQSVHERVVKLGISRGLRLFTKAEREQIQALYHSGFKRGEGAVAALAKKLGRSIGAIYTFACANGWCDANRPMDAKLHPAIIEGSAQSIRQRKEAGTYRNSQTGAKWSMDRKRKASESSKKMWAQRTQTETRAIRMKMEKTRFMKYGRIGNLKRPGISTWKAAWVEVGGQRFYARSRWEANYAHYLEWRKQRGEITSWQHEPEVFWFEKIKRGVCSYLPDFKVIMPDGSVQFHEVKGWMDPKSKTKIKRMAKYHPKVHLDVIDSPRYKALTRQLSAIVPGWQ